MKEESNTAKMRKKQEITLPSHKNKGKYHQMLAKVHRALIWIKQMMLWPHLLPLWYQPLPTRHRLFVLHRQGNSKMTTWKRERGNYCQHLTSPFPLTHAFSMTVTVGVRKVNMGSGPSLRNLKNGSHRSKTKTTLQGCLLCQQREWRKSQE